MSKLARLIAKEEGFGIPGAIPTTHHNPGDLRHSPHSSHDPGAPNAIGKIDSDPDGWADLERQLRLFASRGITLRQMIVDYYAPASENNPYGYLHDICAGLPAPDSMLVSEALKIV